MDNVNDKDTLAYESEEVTNSTHESEAPELAEMDATTGAEAGTDKYADERGDDGEAIDYESLIASDVATLKAEFPELSGITDITDLNNPLRYAALRDLGLTPTEAYLATAKRVTKDTRSHLKSAHGRTASASASSMSYLELAAARELFPGKNDMELQRLYKRVSK